MNELQNTIIKLIEAIEYSNFRISNENNISLDIFLHNEYQNITIPYNYFNAIYRSIPQNFIYENNIQYNKNDNLYTTIPLTKNQINEYNSIIENNEILINKDIININIISEGIIDSVKEYFNNRYNNEKTSKQMVMNAEKDYKNAINYIDYVDNAIDFFKILKNGIDISTIPSIALKASGLDNVLNAYIKNTPRMLSTYYMPRIIDWALKNRNNHKHNQDILARKILDTLHKIKKYDKKHIIAKKDQQWNW